MGWQLIITLSDFAARPHYRTSIYLDSHARFNFPNVTVCNFQR